MPPDANASVAGRQVDLEADGVTEVTVAVKSPMIVDAETMYRVVLTQLAGTTAPLSDDPGLVSLSFEGIDILVPIETSQPLHQQHTFMSR